MRRLSTFLGPNERRAARKIINAASTKQLRVETNAARDAVAKEIVKRDGAPIVVGTAEREGRDASQSGD